MDTALVICILTNHIRSVCIVVERLRRHVGEVSEPIPLGTRLGIHMIDIVKGTSFMKIDDLVFEFLTTECRLLGYVGRQVQTCHLTSTDLCRSGFDSCWGKQVQASNVVVLALYPCGFIRSADDLGEVLPSRE